MKFRAMGQAVGRQPLALEAWLRSRDNPCVICPQSGTDPVSLPELRFFPVSIVPAMPHTHSFICMLLLVGQMDEA